MRLFVGLAIVGMTCGCSTLAGMMGFVPVEAADGGPVAHVVPSGVGIEECTSIAGAVSLLSAIGLNLFRNYTRAKALESKMPQGGGTNA